MTVAEIQLAPPAARHDQWLTTSAVCPSRLLPLDRGNCEHPFLTTAPLPEDSG